MTDPIALLQRAAEEAGTQARETDPVTAVRTRVDHRRRTRRGRLVATAAAAVVLLAGIVAVVATQADDQEGVVVSPDPAPTTTEPTSRPADGDVPRSPLSARRGVALASVGDDVVVFGGWSGDFDLLADGAVYDRRAGEWRALPPSPLADRFAEGVPAVAAPVEGGVVVTRGLAVARWDAATDTWTELDDAPSLVTDLTAVGDGRVASFSARAVLDVTTGRWEQPATGPTYEVEATAVTWTGSELIGVGTSPDAPDPGRSYAIAFVPEGPTWREVSPPGERLGDGRLGAAWDGSRVVVTDDEMAAAAYDPETDVWADLPAVPARVALHSPSMTSVGGISVVTMARTLGVLDALRQTWTPFPSPVPSLGGTGPYSLVPVDDATVALWVDGAGPDDPDLLLFDPATLAGRDRRRQVGVASVVMAGDEYVLGTFFDERGALVVDLLTAAGEHCRVTSGLGLPLGSDEQRAIREELPVGDPDGPGAVLVWFHDEAGTRWEAEIDDTDLFVVECDDAGATRRVVESVALT